MYASFYVSLPAISFGDAQSISRGNVGVNGDITGANLQPLEQIAAGNILIALETDPADLIEGAFIDQEGKADPLLVGGVVQGAFIDPGVEISFFAEVLDKLDNVVVDLPAVQIAGGKNESVRLGGNLRAKLSG
ncbi:hypothetical protein ES703_110835 [subsurface metagenome]